MGQAEGGESADVGKGILSWKTLDDSLENWRECDPDSRVHSHHS